ncbi:hypothetical protein HYX12_03905 [Candidatus Woesearchaeota archaeon]|nr:hypothetical protein [Candidatus Woesearchaeota archaeon]
MIKTEEWMKVAKLKKRGWNEKDIEKAESILGGKKSHDVHFSKIVFWSALVIIVIANILVSVVLIPFLVALDTLVLFAIVALLGGVVGFLYKHLITNIGHLELRHHVIAGILIPVIALANVFVMVTLSNKIMQGIGVNLPPHNPWTISLVFAIAFIIPYLARQMKQAVWK